MLIWVHGMPLLYEDIQKLFQANDIQRAIEEVTQYIDTVICVNSPIQNWHETKGKEYQCQCKAKLHYNNFVSNLYKTSGMKSKRDDPILFICNECNRNFTHKDFNDLITANFKSEYSLTNSKEYENWILADPLPAFVSLLSEEQQILNSHIIFSNTQFHDPKHHKTCKICHL